MKATISRKQVPVTTFALEEMVRLDDIPMKDATVLLAILRSISGSVEGPRGAADRAVDALASAGVELDSNTDTFPTMRGGISF